MAYADIVILALVAGFILLRLRHVLGQKIGRDKPDEYRPADRIQGDEPVVTLPERSLRRQEADNKIAIAPREASVEEAASEGVAAIRAGDPLFEPGSFLEGAKIAFEMVFDAFNKGDKAGLKALLATDVYDDFASAIDGRGQQETRHETTLVSVESMRIAEASKEKNQARLMVKFVSEQITVVRNKEGKIVEGDPSQVDRIEDEWVFERDVTSRNPNWKIVAV